MLIMAFECSMLKSQLEYQISSDVKKTKYYVKADYSGYSFIKI